MVHPIQTIENETAYLINYCLNCIPHAVLDHVVLKVQIVLWKLG